MSPISSRVKWVGLVIGFIMAIAVHAVIHIAADSIVNVPAYAPLTDKEALKYIQASCNKEIDLGIDVCHLPQAQAILKVRTLHGYYHEQEVKAIPEKARKMRMNFGIAFLLIYAALGVVTMVLAGKWLTARVRPAEHYDGGESNETVLIPDAIISIPEAAKHLPDAVKHLHGAVKNLPKTVKTLTESRKLRQVESDFLTLQNLFKNGLITEEMYLKRKEALIASLSNSDTFT
jgi:hypothetical protein